MKILYSFLFFSFLIISCNDNKIKFTSDVEKGLSINIEELTNTINKIEGINNSSKIITFISNSGYYYTNGSFLCRYYSNMVYLGSREAAILFIKKLSIQLESLDLGDSIVFKAPNDIKYHITANFENGKYLNLMNNKLYMNNIKIYKSDIEFLKNYFNL